MEIKGDVMYLFQSKFYNERLLKQAISDIECVSIHIRQYYLSKMIPVKRHNIKKLFVKIVGAMRFIHLK